MPELRIALLTHSVNPRGGVVHTLELANALHDRGHHVNVFAPALPGQTLFRTPRCAVDLVPIAAAPADVPAMISTRRAAYVQHLTQRLQTTHFDILHAQDGIGGTALADLCDAGAIDGYVRTVHHLDEFLDPQVMAWQQRAFMRARRVLCVSRTWCDTLLREHGVAATRVHNGVDPVRYSRASDAGDARVAARYGLRPGAPLFVAVGGIEARKNTLRMLEAYLAFRAAQPAAQLVIAGGASLLDHDAYGREFHALCAASGLHPGPGQALVIAGAVPDADMPALLRAADVVLMASLREGFGLVVLEALACGTPVVVSRVAPFTEYLSADEHADHCCWADPMAPGSIAQAMQRALQPAHALALARHTPSVCERFSWDASAAAHEALYLSQLVPAGAGA